MLLPLLAQLLCAAVQLQKPLGVEVGHVDNVEVGGGRTIQRRTVSLDPLVFVVDDFLSDEETEHLLRLGQETGFDADVGFQSLKEEDLSVQDLNNDGLLGLDEVRLMLEDNFRALLSPDDVAAVLRDTGLDADGDGQVSQAELGAWAEARGDDWISQLRESVRKLERADGGRSMRVSEQVWLRTDSDDKMKDIVGRAADLAGLPAALRLPGASDLLIVRYQEGGHYHAHYDSHGRDSPQDQPCCHTAKQLGRRGKDIDRSLCRSCRWATVLLYLADTDGGGHTVFPVTSAEYNRSDFSYLRWRLDWNRSSADHYCAGGSGAVRVQPKRGRAALFYSHEETELPDGRKWMGPNDPFSLHGSCGVTAGGKQTGNLWLWADPFPSAGSDEL